MTTTDSWLPLAEYSIKYNVSISTLRRRIKTDDIKFRFDDGKYMILDESPKRMITQSEESRSAFMQQNAIVSEPRESVLTAANKLLADLKKAYTQILQEKEEQILGLKEEIVDLRTLIKVLESENSRLRDLNQ